MTLETIYYVGQTIAVVVIIATLAAVLMQSRQANKIARADLTRAQLAEASNMIESIYNSPDLVEILLKVDARERLNREELFRFNYYMFSWWSNMQGAYNLKKNGLMDPQSYRQILNAGNFLCRSSICQHIWMSLREIFPDDFAKEIDVIFENEAGRPPEFTDPT